MLATCNLWPTRCNLSAGGLAGQHAQQTLREIEIVGHQVVEILPVDEQGAGGLRGQGAIGLGCAGQHGQCPEFGPCPGLTVFCNLVYTSAGHWENWGHQR
jgi:hypothetical protein